MVVIGLVNSGPSQLANQRPPCLGPTNQLKVPITSLSLLFPSLPFPPPFPLTPPFILHPVPILDNPSNKIPAGFPAGISRISRHLRSFQPTGVISNCQRWRLATDRCHTVLPGSARILPKDPESHTETLEHFQVA